MPLKSNIKLFIADMEGTLFYPVVKMTHGVAPSSWTLIAQNLGEKALKMEEQMKKDWNGGGYINGAGEQSYCEFMRSTVLMHQMCGLTKDIYDVAIQTEYHPGVKEFYSYLRKQNIRTALISGGFKAQADRASKDLKIDYALAGCEYFWNEDGTISHYNLHDADYLGKVNFIRGVMKQEGLLPHQCAFVGDGPNDVLIAREVGLSISFNGCSKLEDCCNYVIRQDEGNEDFRELAKIFGDGAYHEVMDY